MTVIKMRGFRREFEKGGLSLVEASQLAKRVGHVVNDPEIARL